MVTRCRGDPVLETEHSTRSGWRLAKQLASEKVRIRIGGERSDACCPWLGGLLSISILSRVEQGRQTVSLYNGHASGYEVKLYLKHHANPVLETNSARRGPPAVAPGALPSFLSPPSLQTQPLLSQRLVSSPALPPSSVSLHPLPALPRDY